MHETPGEGGEKPDIKGYYMMQPKICRDGSLLMKIHYYDGKVYLCIQAAPPPASRGPFFLAAPEPDADTRDTEGSCIRKAG